MKNTNKRIIAVACALCCIAVTATGCAGKKDNEAKGLNDCSREQAEEQDAAKRQNKVNSEAREEDETAQAAPEDVSFHYFCLDAQDPAVQALIADGDGFMSREFIRGLPGYTPECDPFGELEWYSPDTEITVTGDQGLFVSDRLAEVKEFLLNVLMDMVRRRGDNVGEYRKYFADETLPQQFETYLKTQLEEDWLLLESFYLSFYAGNEEEIAWYGQSETVWVDEENEVTHRRSETDSQYNFEFLFYADYRTMNCEKREREAALAVNCALSKETGLIEEIAMSRWYISREDFETSRW